MDAELYLRLNKLIIEAKDIEENFSEYIGKSDDAFTDMNISISCLEDVRKNLMKLDPLSATTELTDEGMKALSWLASDHVTKTLKRFREEEKNENTN